MTCPRCKCPECRRVELQAVLARHVARETPEGTSTSLNVPSVDQWCDTFGGPRPGRFVERREIGKPPVDPDAEQLAGYVVREMARAG